MIGRRLWVLLPYSIIAVAVGVILGDRVVAGSQKPAPPAPASQQATAAQQSAQHRGDPRGLFSPGLGDRWWLVESTKTELGLTPQQVTAIQKVYDDEQPELVRLWGDVIKAQTELSKLAEEGQVDESVIQMKVMMAETPRVKTDTARILMLYRMYQVLTPDQRKKLVAMVDRGRSGRGGERREQGPPR